MQLEFIHAPNEIGDESSRRKIMLGRRGKNPRGRGGGADQLNNWRAGPLRHRRRASRRHCSSGAGLIGVNLGGLALARSRRPRSTD